MSWLYDSVCTAAGAVANTATNVAMAPVNVAQGAYNGDVNQVCDGIGGAVTGVTCVLTGGTATATFLATTAAMEVAIETAIKKAEQAGADGDKLRSLYTLFDDSSCEEQM